MMRLRLSFIRALLAPMRRLAVALVLVACVGVGAQPDPTDPALYAPLGVGSEWRYVHDTVDAEGYVLGRAFERQRVAGTVDVDGVTWSVVTREEALEVVPAWHEVSRDTVRFDAALAVLLRLEEGEEIVESCPLDAAFGAMVTCVIGGEETQATVTGSATTQKAFVVDPAVPYPVYRAGLGLFGIDADGEEAALDSLPDLYAAEVVGPDGSVTEFGYPDDFVPDVAPDPTDPARYYPLHIGFERENYIALGPSYLRRTRTEVRRDTVIGDVTYAIKWSANVPTEFVFSPTDLPASIDWGEGNERLLRFDAATARVLRRTDDGTDVPETPPLDADSGTLVLLGDEPAWDPLPDGREGDFVAAAYSNTEYPIAGVTVSFEAVKSYTPVPISLIYDGPDQRWTYLTGAGRLPPAYYFSCWHCVQWVTYLRTRDAAGNEVEYGTMLATAAETLPTAGALTLQAGPTPTTGALTLHLGGAAGEVTLEAFDALGRRMWSREAVGRSSVAVDASGWASGLYVVRARTAREQVATTVVRR